MADIPLIPRVQSQPVQPVTTQAPTAAPTQSAPALAVLPAGTLLNGFVVNRDASGNPILRTSTGDIPFTSDQFLKIGSQVLVRVENIGGTNVPHILEVNGLPPEIGAAQAAGLEQDTITNSTLLPSTTAATTSSTEALLETAEPVITLNGTILSPTQAQSSLQTGTQLGFTLLGVETASTADISLPVSTLNNFTPAQYAAYARAAGTTVPGNVPFETVSLPAVTTQQAALSPQTAQETIPAIAPAIPVATPIAGQTTTVQITATTVVPDTQAIAVTEQAQQPAIAVPILTSVPDTGVPFTQVLPVGAFVTAPVETESPVEGVSEDVAAVPAAVASPAVGTATEEPHPSPLPGHIAVAAPLLPAVGAQVEAGQTITATVISTPPTGEIIAQTPFGVIKLQAGVALPVGSTVTFQISSITSPQEQAMAAERALSTTPTSLTQLARQWPALQQIFSLLSDTTDSTGQDFAHTGMPWLNTAPTQALQQQATIAPQSVSTGMMLFISALRGGDFRNWLGKDNSNWLEDHGHDALLKKAEGEFMGLSRQFTEPVAPHQWQTLFFPIAIGGELQQTRLFIKRDRKQGGKEQNRNDEDTRFVVEVDMTQLGEMQMDGFVRRQEQNVQFDLIIRSQNALTPEMQNDILQIYTATGELTGYKGSIAFQTVKEFPVNPMDDIANHHHMTGGVVA